MTTYQTPPLFPCSGRSLVRGLGALVAGLFFSVPGLLPGAAGAEAAPAAKARVVKRTFDIPAGDAFSTLKRFFVQSGEQVIYRADSLAGVRTSPVKGEYTPLQALTTMLSRTDFAVSRDEQTGTLAITPGTAAQTRSTTPLPAAAQWPPSAKKKRTNP